MATKVDLTGATGGQIGDGFWFSELFWLAVKANFTGGFLVKTPKGDAAYFFRGGRPVHAAGGAYGGAFLGELMLKAGTLTQSRLNEALERQAAEPGPNKPLLGAFLMQSGSSAHDIKKAIQQQNEIRAQVLFGLTSGTWKGAPGENARIFDIGVPVEGWPILMRALASGAVEAEMRALADKLLGKSVKLKSTMMAIAGLELDADQRKLIHYLDKPRKPDQLERALNRRSVRAMLRLLDLEDRLDLLPVGQGIPIPKATLLKGQSGFSSSEVETSTSPEQPSSSPHNDRVAPPRAASAKIDPVLKREIEDLHAAMGEKNHFEMLGVTQKTNAADLRKTFTVLAKKYHPDAFPPGTNEELANKAQEISARLNESYQTLTNDKARAEYEELLADDRIKGDSRKAERIRDAETKFKMGLVMIKKKEFQKAREFFRFCMDADPDAGEYKGYYAWSMFADSGFDRAEANAKCYGLLVDALKKAEKSAAVHYFAGAVLKSQDRQKEALHHFKTALKLDKKHTEAEREVRLLEMREKKGDEKEGKPSAFAKLFKR